MGQSNRRRAQSASVSKSTFPAYYGSDGCAALSPSVDVPPTEITANDNKIRSVAPRTASMQPSGQGKILQLATLGGAIIVVMQHNFHSDRKCGCARCLTREPVKLVPEEFHFVNPLNACKNFRQTQSVNEKSMASNEGLILALAHSRFFGWTQQGGFVDQTRSDNHAEKIVEPTLRGLRRRHRLTRAVPL